MVHSHHPAFRHRGCAPTGRRQQRGGSSPVGSRPVGPKHHARSVTDIDRSCRPQVGLAIDTGLALEPGQVSSHSQWEDIGHRAQGAGDVVPRLAALVRAGSVPPAVHLVDYRWRSTRTDAGVTLKLHELRHYFASGLIAAGCDEVTVQRAMGHASATLSTYAHLWPTAEDKTRAAASGMGPSRPPIATGSRSVESIARSGSFRCRAVLPFSTTRSSADGDTRGSVERSPVTPASGRRMALAPRSMPRQPRHGSS